MTIHNEESWMESWNFKNHWIKPENEINFGFH